MFPSPHRVRLPSAADVIVCAAIVISAACHHARPAAPQPTQRSMDEVRRFAGADIVSTGNSGFLVRFHSGAVGNGEPLYVIDGAPMRIPPHRGIDWFKPEDIVELKVLRYPYELAEYGADGANGVVIITTKQNPQRPRNR